MVTMEIAIMSEYDGFEWYENAPDGASPQPPTKYERVVKTCRMCDLEMDMSSDHGVCDSCASMMERGGNGSMDILIFFIVVLVISL